MIQRINTISFGTSSAEKLKAKMKEAEERKKELIDGSIGLGGATLVAKGNKTVKAISGMTKNTVKKTSAFKTYTMRFQQCFKDILESMSKVKGLGWASKATKTIAFGTVGKVAGGFLAISVCAKDFNNMVKVSARIFDGKFPVLDSFGLNNK